MEPVEMIALKIKDRKPLHVLQPAATDKETLVGADRILRPIKSKETKTKQKITETVKKDASKKVIRKNKAVQAVQEKIEAIDLTSDYPSEKYWQILAERRRAALVNALEKNEKLIQDIEKLKAENYVYKEMVDDAKLLVEVLQE